jgi:lysophospholipase L1-like esterase
MAYGEPDGASSSPLRRWFLRLGIPVILALVLIAGLKRRGHGGPAQPLTEGIYRTTDDPEMPVDLVLRPDVPLVNAAGYVGQEYPKERRNDAYRILGLGEYVTMDHTSNGTNYLQVMQADFKRSAPDHPIEVLDFGVAGYDTVNEVRRLEVVGLQYRPDLVTVGYVMTDAIDFSAVAQAAFGGSVPAGMAESRPRLEALLGQLAGSAADRKTFLDKVFSQAEWTRTLRAFNKLEELANDQRFQVLVIIFPVFASLDHYTLWPVHDAVRLEAEKHHFAVFDLLPVYIAAGPAVLSEKNGADPMHPNELGHSIAGHALHAYLSRGHFSLGKRPPPSVAEAAAPDAGADEPVNGEPDPP